MRRASLVRANVETRRDVAGCLAAAITCAWFAQRQVRTTASARLRGRMGHGNSTAQAATAAEHAIADHQLGAASRRLRPGSGY